MPSRIWSKGPRKRPEEGMKHFLTLDLPGSQRSLHGRENCRGKYRVSFNSTPRMTLLVNPLKLAQASFCVVGRGGQIGVAEEFGDGADVGTAFE